ncbi:hypothetical protein ACFRQM_45160 [Streptomyces sp. NPDC056831]|uniref:hypothetical protein n=1 Tax=Streptomyces sp. NPDC056831 TaxID=3345954 RepID=UPI0036CD88A9
MNAGLLPQLAVLGAEPLDLLASEKQVGLLAGSGDLPSALLVLVSLGRLASPGLVDAFAQARGIDEPAGDARLAGDRGEDNVAVVAEQRLRQADDQ